MKASRSPSAFYFHSYELRKQNGSSWNANYQLQTSIGSSSDIYIMKILIRSTLSSRNINSAYDIELWVLNKFPLIKINKMKALLLLWLLQFEIN